MIIIHGMRPRYKDIWFAVGSLLLMLIPSIRLNEAFPGSDYLFLKLDTSLFPESQYMRALIYTGLIILIFHAMWFMWKLIDRSGAAAEN